MRTSFGILCLGLFCTLPALPAKRVVILKIDGLNADLLSRSMAETDPETGKSRLPWFTHVFAEQGIVFQNFYTRGISLSAPSWAMLDSGYHSVIRGNVEYDRYTGQVYDYLNFFPFYLGYARSQQVDMPGVEVLDRAGIRLMIDQFPERQRYQSVQLLQRGVRWSTLSAVLHQRLKSQLLSPVESGAPEPLGSLLYKQQEIELQAGAAQPEVFYLDFYTGDVDHEAHLTNQSAALADVLRNLDALVGRIWTIIQTSPLAAETIFVAVSDHGMNNKPGVQSQGFNLPDFFNSPAGGGHHVVTNRPQLSNYKIRGLDPLVQRVINPSTASTYLAGQADRYPTAWLDLDGNERASVHLRNNDLNRIHILLQQLARKDLQPAVRTAAAACLHKIVETHRQSWTDVAAQMDSELASLERTISAEKVENKAAPHHWDQAAKRNGLDKAARRLTREIAERERELSAYRNFLLHLRSLLRLQQNYSHIENFVPPFELGDPNTLADLQSYVVGPSLKGLSLAADGSLDEERSFRHVNYFPLLLSQQVRNNPQPLLSNRPIDFVTMRQPDQNGRHAFLIYGSEEAQLTILTSTDGRISLLPRGAWRSGLPLHLYEDPDLQIPGEVSRAEWLSAPHTESEWLTATHRCHYSNAVVGIAEHLSPVEDNMPNQSSYERRRRALVQPDFHIFAADGWNFNARDFNAGGNHGSFFRISTHSVWMMAGAGLPMRTIEEPYDSLNFASTLLSLLGRHVPLPTHAVSLVK